MDQNQVSDIEELYSYQGWLIFNQIFETDPYNTDTEPGKLIERFPTYEGGSPNEADSGFKKDDFPNHLNQLPELTDDLKMFAQSLHAFTYIDEDWVEEWGYDENANEKIFYKDYHDEIEIFWDSEGQVMMIKGDKTLVERKEDDLRSGLADELKLNSVNFDFDFFLWVLYKEYIGETLSSNFRVRKITRGKTLGSHEDKLGKHTEVRGTENILKSLMMIAPILAGKRIESLQGEFILNQKIIDAEIQHGGKVHVKVSDSPLQSMSDLRRMGLSLQFLSGLVELFTQWENLDSNDRYPPPEFFDDLADEAEEQGWKPNFDPQTVKQEYRRKRKSPDEGSEEGTVPAEDAT